MTYMPYKEISFASLDTIFSGNCNSFAQLSRYIKKSHQYPQRATYYLPTTAGNRKDSDTWSEVVGEDTFSFICPFYLLTILLTLCPLPCKSPNIHLQLSPTYPCGLIQHILGCGKYSYPRGNFSQTCLTPPPNPPKYTPTPWLIHSILHWLGGAVIY